MPDPDNDSTRPLASLENPDIERDEPLGVAAPRNPEYSSSFDEFAGALAREHSTFFGDRGADYERYREAYEFGLSISPDRRFADRSWVTSESEIRGLWEKQRRSVGWEDAKQAIQAGWETARGAG